MSAMSARRVPMPRPVSAEVTTISGKAAGWRREVARDAGDGGGERGRARACRPWSARAWKVTAARSRSCMISASTGLMPVAGVDEHEGAAQRRAAGEVGAQQRLPALDHGLRRLGEAVAGQVDQVVRRAEREEVDLLGAAGGVRGAGERLAPGQRVDQASTCRRWSGRRSRPRPGRRAAGRPWRRRPSRSRRGRRRACGRARAPRRRAPAASVKTCFTPRPRSPSGDAAAGDDLGVDAEVLVAPAGARARRGCRRR